MRPLGKRCLLYLWNFFFFRSSSMPCLFALLTIPLHFSLSLSPFFFLDLLMCIVIS